MAIIRVKITPKASAIPKFMMTALVYRGCRIFEKIPFFIILTISAGFSWACLWFFSAWTWNNNPLKIIIPPTMFNTGKRGNFDHEKNNPNIPVPMSSKYSIIARWNGFESNNVSIRFPFFNFHSPNRPTSVITWTKSRQAFGLWCMLLFGAAHHLHLKFKRAARQFYFTFFAKSYLLLSPWPC